MKFNKELFERLYNLDIAHLVEKQYQGLSYLSWAVAYKLLLEHDINATYEVVKASDGLPFFTRGKVNFVFTKVSAFETTIEQYLPIMDSRYKAVADPDSRQVNDAIQRCLAKNIAMFGIGLKLYVGEDLEQFKDNKQPPKQEEVEYNRFLRLLKQKEYDKETFKSLLIEGFNCHSMGEVAKLSVDKMQLLCKELEKYEDKK